MDREILTRAAVAAAHLGVSILPGTETPDPPPLREREAELDRELGAYLAITSHRATTVLIEGEQIPVSAGCSSR